MHFLFTPLHTFRFLILSVGLSIACLLDSKVASARNDHTDNDVSMADPGELNEQRRVYYLDLTREDNDKWFKNVPPEVLGNFLQAQILLQFKHKPKSAMKLLNEIIAKYPAFLTAHITRGEIFQEQKQFDSALKEFTTVIDAKPADLSTRKCRISIYIERKELRKALADATEVLRYHPFDLSTIHRKASLNEQLGNKKAADADRRDALAKEMYAIGPRRMTKVFWSDKSDELEWFTRLIRKYPRAAIAYAERGDILAAQGKHVEAMQDFAVAARLPCAPVIRAFVLGDWAYCLAVTKSYDAAIKKADEAIAVYEKSRGTYGDWQHANAEDAYIIKADALFEIHKYKESAAVASEYIRRFPLRCRGYLRRVNALVALKQYREAIADSEKVVALDPLSERAMLTTARLSENTGDAKKAIDYYTRLVHWHPELTDVYLARGRLYRKLGRNSEALQDYGKMIAVNSDDPVPYVERAQLHAAMGNKDAARADLKFAINISPEDRTSLEVELAKLK